MIHTALGSRYIFETLDAMNLCIIFLKKYKKENLMGISYRILF